MKTCILLFLLLSCASNNKPNFKPSAKTPNSARIYVYWPRQWQSQWAEFQIDLNQTPVKILKNEGFIEILNPPAKSELKSHHVQDSKFIVLINVDVKPGKDYFFKLDTQPKELTLMSAWDDISAIGTIVNGMKSQMKLKEGRGSWQDAKNYIKHEQQKLEMEDKKKELGYHVLLPIDEALALKELESCCSSENVK